MAKLGFFSLIFNGFRASSPTLPSADDLGFEVVGEASYQTGIASIAGPKTPDGHDLFCIALLIPEPGNLHDPNAVMVRIDGTLVGYLSRQSARAYHARFKGCLESDARIVGGWKRDRGSEGAFGVRLEGPLRQL